MIAKRGSPLLTEEAMGCMRDMLVPLADILTSTCQKLLLGQSEAENREDVLSQAKALLGLGARNVYLKGGHFKSDESPDLMLTLKAEHWLESERIDTKNTHGTGCSLSASIAANMANSAS